MTIYVNVEIAIGWKIYQANAFNKNLHTHEITGSWTKANSFLMIHSCKTDELLIKNVKATPSK